MSKLINRGGALHLDTEHREIVDLSPVTPPPEYHVVGAVDTLDNLHSGVRAFIQDGWTPQAGGFSAVYYPGSSKPDTHCKATVFFYQVMTREGKS